jgi:flagellar biosynthesis/type III secretory pathway chaperone
MSTLDANLTALLDALALEAEHLEQLNGLLLEEAAALRRLDRALLERLSPRLEACVVAHLELAKRRDAALRGLLPDAASPSLSMVVGRGVDPSGRTAALLLQLRGLVRGVQRLRAANEAYALTGRSAIEERLTRLHQRAASRAPTYGPRGRISGHGVGPRLRDRG